MPDSQAPVRAPRTTRATRIVLWVIGLLVAIPAIALVVLLNYDWNKARPWLNAKTSEAIGRPFAINGDLSLKWEKQPLPGDAAWRDHIPWPHLIANDVHISNPAGMPARDMASVKQLSFSLSPFALLRHTIVVPELRFAAPAVDLLRNADGANNWTFHHEEKPSPWTLDLERVVFTKGVVHLADAVEKADITADIDTIDNDAKYGVSWTLRGKFNGAPVTGNGKAGAVRKSVV